YNELTMGQNGNKDINRIGHKSHTGFNGPRVIGYPESHDEERIMYKNLQFGSSSNPSHDVKDLDVALSRMSAMAAVSVMVPGPKMIWHFGELGMENSIFTCQNGTVNLPDDGIGGDCKLDTKPQPQWTNNWLSDPERAAIYNDWARLHFLKINEPVFEGDYTLTSSSSNYTPRIDIFDTNIPVTELRNVIILSNFNVNATNVNTNFPIAGTWYDLMDETGNTTIESTTTSVNIPAGQFRIFGNQPAQTLSTNDLDRNLFTLHPNPTNTSFYLNVAVKTVEIYDISGKRVKTFNGDFERNIPFDISSIKTGLYLVKITNGDGLSNTTKLVKL
ncbi:MAG: T9SS type A sorting domain-containing protein, partial [Winogradskyella sp.]|nr:T9SS type A sorting domain-containing protein [Winogradskyella sp.]